MNEQNEVFTQIVPNVLYWFLNLHILPDPSYIIFFVINFFHENTEYIDPKSHKYTIPMPKDTKNTNKKPSTPKKTSNHKSKHQVHQTKHQVRQPKQHPNQKYFSQNIKYTNQNTKYAVSI